MKRISVIFTILFVILAPVMFLLTDVQLIAYNREYYREEYNKYRIPEYIGMDMPNLMDSTEKLLLYLENKRADLDFKAGFNNGDEEFFSQRDKEHMVDVKGLFIKGRLIRDFSALYVLIVILTLFWRKPFKKQMRKLAGYSVAAALAGLIPVIVLIILMNIDFYKYFTIFHEIFFTNELWLLDPATDRLINIFPQDLFTDMAFRISYFYIAEMVAILIIGILTLKFLRADY
ncbi:MAG TPA: TIGR01906 family membrane protein [Bacillota bacterium]|nr:TIGR01906 family membrane protein [Bacillota bacterium]